MTGPGIVGLWRSRLGCLQVYNRNWGSAVYEVWSQGPISKVESAVIGFRDPTLEIVIVNIPDPTEARRQDSLGLDRPNLAGQGQAMAVEGEALKEGALIKQAQRASAGEGPEEITNEEVTDLLTVETAMTASVDRPKEGRAAPGTAIEAALATGVDEEALDRCTKRRVAPSKAHIKATETVMWAGYSRYMPSGLLGLNTNSSSLVCRPSLFDRLLSLSLFSSAVRYSRFFCAFVQYAYRWQRGGY